MVDRALLERVRAEAERRGVDPDVAAAHAEEIMSGDSEAAPAGPSEPARPIADRLLIGFLPFVRVRELRSLWLGLPDRIPDDDLTCGDYSLKHGGAPAKATDAPE